MQKCSNSFSRFIHLLWLLIALNIAATTCRAQMETPLNKKEVALTKAALKGRLTDSARIELIWNLGKYHMLNKPGNFRINLDSALIYFKYSLKLVDSLKMKSNFKYECMCRIGEVYLRMKNVPVGKSVFMQVVKAYRKAKDKKREARTWFRLGVKLRHGEPKDPEISYYLKKALVLYRELNQIKEVGDVLMEIGITNVININNITGNLDSAENQLRQAVKLYKQIDYRDHNLSVAYYNLSLVDRNKGKLDESLANSITGIRAAEAIGDTTTLGVVPYYGQLGLIYSDLGNQPKSAENYRKAIALSLRHTEVDVAPDITYSYLNELVRSLLSVGKIREARGVSGRLMKRYPPVDTLQYGLAAEITGRYYEALQQYSRAERSYLSMSKFYRGMGAIETWGYKVLSAFYLKQKKYGLAKKALRSQYSNLPANTMAFSTLIDDELAYYKIDSAEGNLSSAIAHFKKYKTLSDSAFNITKSNQLARLTIQYETEQKEKDIILLKKDALLEREKTIKANNSRNLTLAAIIALILFTALLYNAYLINHRKNAELRTLVDDKDDLLEQKEWLVKEIHHRVKNNLQIVMGLLKRQSAYINNEEALIAIRNSENRMHSIALIHQKLYQSDSPGFINMPEYIAELVNYLKDSFDLENRVHFQKNIAHIYMNVTQAVPLGLILNEAITNAIKYAFTDKQYGEVSISFLRTADGYHCLMIKDNGVGLPQDFDASTADSMGMNLMKGLSKQLGGIFSITSVGGMAISVKFSVENFGYAGASE